MASGKSVVSQVRQSDSSGAVTAVADRDGLLRFSRSRRSAIGHQSRRLCDGGKVEFDAVRFGLRELEPVEEVFVARDETIIHPLRYQALRNPQAFGAARNPSHQRKAINFDGELFFRHPPIDGLARHTDFLRHRSLRQAIGKENRRLAALWCPLKL